MLYHQKSDLIPGLLFVGILGGLFAPLSLEAAAPSPPTIKLQMDSGTPITLTTTLSPCLAVDKTAGYNYCYSMTTGQLVGTSPKQYRVMPNGTARLRIADKNGQDKMSLTGVQFVPVGTWPNTEAHTLKITVSGSFNATTDPFSTPTPDAPINQNNTGTYKWALRSSGEFIPNAGSDAVGNSITLTGTGTFSAVNLNKNIISTTGTRNLTPLNFTVKGPAATSDTSWGGISNTDLGQVDPSYPQFDCRGVHTGNPVSTSCRAAITQTLTATIYGRDTLKVLSGPLDVFGVNCAETFSGEEIQRQIRLLTGQIRALEYIEPRITKPTLRDNIKRLIIHLKAVLAATTIPPSDPACPGAQVLTFHMALEQAVDGLVIASDPNSSPVEPENPHYYAVINSPGMTWEQARAAAQGIRTDCDLATITTAAEQAILNGLLPDPSEFIGSPKGFRDYWVGGRQLAGSSEPGGNWRWINEEGTFWDNGPTSLFANWGSTSTGPDNEPNNLGGSENHLTVDSRWTWGWNDLNTDGATGTTNGYITEGTAGLCVPPVIP